MGRFGFRASWRKAERTDFGFVEVLAFCLLEVLFVCVIEVVKYLFVQGKRGNLPLLQCLVGG